MPAARTSADYVVIRGIIGNFDIKFVYTRVPEVLKSSPDFNFKRMT